MPQFDFWLTKFSHVTKCAFLYFNILSQGKEFNEKLRCQGHKRLNRFEITKIGEKENLIVIQVLFLMKLKINVRLTIYVIYHLFNVKMIAFARFSIDDLWRLNAFWDVPKHVIQMPNYITVLAFGKSSMNIWVDIYPIIYLLSDSHIYIEKDTIWR